MDLLSKIKSIFNKTMDDEGWVRGGRFAPLVNIADKTKNLKSFSQTLNPTYNKGDNFWSSKTGQNLANFQRQTQDLVKPTLNRLKQGKSLLNLYEYSSPAVALRHKVDNTQSQLPTNYKPWQDIKHSLSAGMTAYGLAKPNIALTSALGGGVFNTALNMGSNVINKKPLTQNNATVFKQGFGQGLANAGTTRLTNSLVNSLANYIPALKPLTNKSLNVSLTADTLKQSIKKWADVAGKKLFKSAVIETMVETPVWATLNSSDKEKWTDAMKREFVENLVTNIGFAGVDSIGDVAKMSPVIKKTIGDVVQKYKNLPIQQKMGGKIDLTQPIKISSAKIKYPKDKLKAIEQTIYGTVTPKGETFQTGTKEGVGFIGNSLRKAEKAVSDTVEKGVTSKNKVVRNISRLAQGFLGELGKTDKTVGRLGKFIGGTNYASKLAYDSQIYGAGLVDNNKKSLEKIWSVMDTELAGKKVKLADLNEKELKAFKFFSTLSDFINDTNYKNGFISKELWEKNKGGKYIARAYEQYDLPPEVADFLKQTRKRFDLSSFIKRKDIDDWKQANSIKDPSYLMAKRLQQTLFNDEVHKMFDWLGKTELVSDVAKPGFEQLSDHKAYGELAGKWVRKDVMDDISGLHFTNDFANRVNDLLKIYDRNPVRRTYKKIFTIFNPAVRLGNKTSNYVFAWFNGINPITFAKNQKWAKQQVNQQSELYRRLVKDGILGSDVFKADLTDFAKKIKLEYGESNAKKILNAIEKGYGTVDDVAKVASVKTWLDRGLSYKEAIDRAYRGFQNYRTVGWLYDIGAKLPVFGNPFVRFKGDFVRMAKNAMIDRPARVIGTVIAWKLLTNIMSRLSGESKEDQKVREARLGSPKVPFTNISMAVQTPWGEVNASRLLGVYTYPGPGQSSTSSTISDYMPFETPSKKTLGSSPDIGPFLSIMADTDFRGKSIADPNSNKYTGSTLTTGERNINRLRYLGRQYNIPIANNLIDLSKSLQGKEDFYGRTLTPIQAALRTYPGIKVQQFGPEQVAKQKETNQYYAKAKTKSIQGKIKSVNKLRLTGKITEKVAKKRIDALRGKIKIKEVEPINSSVDQTIPQDQETFNAVYKETASDLSRYKKKAKTLPYEARSEYDEYDRQYDIADNQQKLNLAKDMLAKMEESRPEMAFNAQLDTYKSGGGQTVDERAKWASSKLKGLKGKEFNDTVNKMLEAKVLTKSVVKKLREMGVSVSKYNSGGKIKSYGGKGRKIRITRRKITISKVKMPKLSSSKLKPLKLTKAPSSKIVRDKKLYKAIKIKQPQKVRKIRVAKLPTMKVSKGGFLT